MTSVRDVALRILIRVESDRAHAAPLLDARGASLPPRDRDLLRAVVKRTLRGAVRLDHVLARHLDRPVAMLDPPVRAALRLGAAQLLLLDRIPPHAAVSETVDALKALSPRAAGLVNAVLRRVARHEAAPGRVVLPDDAPPLRRLALETSHPEWLVRRWVATMGEERARGALLATAQESPIDLLVDPRLGSRADVARRLRADGVETVESPWAPLALTVVPGPAAAEEPARSAAGHPLVRGGALPVVDAAAQAMVELLEPAPVVVDLAAAPGGKTRALLFRGIGERAVAFEKQPARAARLRSNLAASGLSDRALTVLADSRRSPLHRGSASSVLLDAPCSGTGTLRKNPEILLRLAEGDLAGFAAVQRALLGPALDLLAPGGLLVYVTCSLEPEENEAVVEAALANRDGFARETPDRSRLPAPMAVCVSTDGVVRVSPGETNDGFTAITIRRTRQVR